MNKLILDIDLDRFVEPIVIGPSRRKRPNSKRHVPWKREQINDFLQDRLGLDELDPILGARFINHDAVYHHIDTLVSRKILVPPFDWIHIDGHDDIGGIASSSKITPANFLLHCIKRDWIESLIFCIPEEFQNVSSQYVKHGPTRIEFDGHAARIATIPIKEIQLGRRPDYLCFILSPSFSPIELDAFFEESEKYILSGP